MDWRLDLIAYLYNLEGDENQINVIASLTREDDRPNFSLMTP
jgi:hypothetical protein